MKEYNVEYVTVSYYVKYHKMIKRTLTTIERAFLTEKEAVEFYNSLPEDIVPSLAKYCTAITIKDKDGKRLTRSYNMK